MGKSVSFRTSNKMTSIGHNNRTEEDREKLQDKDKHVQWENTHKNIILESKDIRDVYHEQFFTSIVGYNMKQKRKDRKISTEHGAYYKKVRDEKGKGNSEEQREFIVQFGRKDDENFDIETSNEMFTEYLDEFKERNPDMIVYNAVIHNDEATPHMHFNIVPVGRGYKRGLAVQPSFTRALETSGVTFDEMMERERESLADIMEKHTGVKRELVGTHDYIPPSQYREMMSGANEKMAKADLILASADEKLVEVNEHVKKINERYADIKVQEQGLSDRAQGLDVREREVAKREKDLQKGNKTLETSQKAFESHMETREDEIREELENGLAERKRIFDENENDLANRRDRVTVREIDVSKREKGSDEKEKKLEKRESKLEKGEVALESSKTAFETFKGDEMEELNEKVKEVQAEHLKLTELMEQAKTWTIGKLEELKEKLKKPVKVEMPELYDDDLADLNDDKQMKL